MAVLSCMRPFTQGLRSVLKNRPQILSVAKQGQYAILPVRAAGSIPIRGPRYMERRLRDQYHFFLALGIIPVSLIIAYTNLFMPHGELTDIPEDYSPHTWEYYSVSAIPNLYGCIL